MLLDEASANVDLATDDALQETIRTQFASSTVPPLRRDSAFISKQPTPAPHMPYTLRCLLPLVSAALTPLCSRGNTLETCTAQASCACMSPQVEETRVAQ